MFLSPPLLKTKKLVGTNSRLFNIQENHATTRLYVSKSSTKVTQTSMKDTASLYENKTI